MKKLWFAAKKYGWGWYPITWQGWLVLGGYVLVIAGTVVIFQTHITEASPVWFMVKVIAATVILVAICWKTGENPRWRWGMRKSRLVVLRDVSMWWGRRWRGMRRE